MPAVKEVAEPCAGKPHARIEVAAGGNRSVGLRQPHGPGASRRPDHAARKRLHSLATVSRLRAKPARVSGWQRDSNPRPSGYEFEGPQGC